MAVIFITVFMYLIGFGVIIPILPLLAKQFGATPFAIGFLLASYSLMQFLFAPFWGKMSDKIGRRPVLLSCLAAEVFCYLLFAQSNNFYVLLLARSLSGFFGASISTASAYISDITPANQRSKGMAVVGIAFGLGFIIGPALGGFLAHLQGIGQDVTSGGVEMATRAASQGYWVAGLYLFAFIFAYIKLVESKKPNTHGAHGLDPKVSRWASISSQLIKPQIGSLLSVYFLQSLAMSCMEATLILFVSDKFGWTYKEVSFGFAYIGVMMILTQGVLVRRLVPLLGERIVLVSGLILFSVGLAGIGFSNNLTVLTAAMTVFAIGNGLSGPAALGSISLLASEREQGATLGVAQSMASLGRIFGPILGGALFGLSMSLPFWTSGLLGGICLLMVQSQYSALPNAGKLK